MNNRSRLGKKMEGRNQIPKGGLKQQKSSIGEPILKTSKSSNLTRQIRLLKKDEETPKIKKANKVSFINNLNLYIGSSAIPLISLIFLK